MSEEIIVGIVAAPELPAKMARRNVKWLPQLFTDKVDKHMKWNLEIVVDPLIGSAEQVDEMLDKAADLRRERQWQYVVCLTDLPFFDEGHIVAADISTTFKVGLISIPAFGWLPVYRRVRKAITQILGELYYGDLNGQDKSPLEQERYSVNLLQKQFPITRVKRVKPTESLKDVETRYIPIPKINGKVRLILGMAQANRPWSIMSSFKKVIAIAFSTGAFGLIFTTLWSLSNILSLVRLSGLMIAAIILMVAWLIFTHRLWERPIDRKNHRLRNLYNRATLLTLTLSVMSYYVVLYVLFLVTVLTLVPPIVFTDAVEIEGGLGFLHYVRLAWITTSISTIAGAIGAGLENDELVKDVIYGYRQKRRYKEIKPSDSEISTDTGE